MKRFRVYEGSEVVFETTNEDVALQMVCNINEDGGNAYYDTDEEIFEVGSVVMVAGIQYEVAKVFSAHYEGDEDGWYAEFLDTKGKYHYWKQGIDGGRVLA